MVSEGREVQSENAPRDMEIVQAACLSVAEALGDFMNRVTIVGGLAPFLLVPPRCLPSDAQHVGTLDLDLAAGAKAYEEISRRLGKAGFTSDRESPGQSPLRWKYVRAGETIVWVDFIADGTVEGNDPWLPEIRFASERRREIQLEGNTLRGERLSTKIWVCSAEVFLLLKALAFRRRAAAKDAHDLYFVLRYYPGDLLQPAAELTRDPAARVLFEVLKDQFADHHAEGPVAVARFLTGTPDDDIQADVTGAARALLEQLFLI